MTPSNTEKCYRFRALIVPPCGVKVRRVFTRLRSLCTGAQGRNSPPGLRRGTCPSGAQSKGAKGDSRQAGPCRKVYDNDQLTDDMKGTGGTGHSPVQTAAAALARCERKQPSHPDIRHPHNYPGQPASYADRPNLPRSTNYCPHRTINPSKQSLERQMMHEILKN
jgi:hypothetical protein